jgi:hypothetical protein
MPFHSVCDAEAWLNSLFLNMCVLQMYTVCDKKCTVSGSVGWFVLQDFYKRACFSAGLEKKNIYLNHPYGTVA